MSVDLAQVPCSGECEHVACAAYRAAAEPRRGDVFDDDMMIFWWSGIAAFIVGAMIGGAL